MKNLALVSLLALGIVASGCGTGGDPAANADPVPAGGAPSTTPVPQPGQKPSMNGAATSGGNAAPAAGRT